MLASQEHFNHLRLAHRAGKRAFKDLLARVEHDDLRALLIGLVDEAIKG
jgi:hypothetical protein